MKYIKRRLFVSSVGDGEIVSEDEFFQLPGLKVILGEPGSGKSSIVGNLLNTGAKSFSPRLVSSGALKPMLHDGQVAVIDGIDEVSAYQTDGRSAIDVLAKVPSDSLPHCIVTCRVADWSAVITDHDLAALGCTPIVGTLVPLDDEEIKTFIGLHNDGFDAVAFLQAAADAGAFELLRNPQMLLMFIDTVAHGSPFPKTRLELYEKASKGLVKEENSVHLRLNVSRKGPDELLRSASFICAQLVLANQDGVDIDGTGGFGITSVDELVHEEFGVSVVRAALGTKLFRQGIDRGIVEPCHRTVAEFLAAKFISLQIGESLSLGRLETILYGPDFVVPAAFRGVHAWLATLHPDVTKEFIKRDPYGFLQYGDSQSISPSDVVFLVRCLEELIETDPFYRIDVLPKGAGRGIARPELKDWLWSIISNTEKPGDLRVLLLECIKGTSIARSIVNELSTVVLDSDDDREVRTEALEVLLADPGQSVGWVLLHSKLVNARDFGSAQLARDMVKANVGMFPGQEVAKTILRYVQAGHSAEIGVVTGGGFAKQMSDIAIADALTFLTTVDWGEDDDEFGLGKDLEKFRFEAIIEVANRPIDLAPEIIWRELEFHSKCYGFLPSFHNLWYRSFEFIPATRLAIQEYVLYGLERCPVASRAQYLKHVCPTLALTGEDAKHFLDKAYSARCGDGGKWQRVWEDIAEQVSSEVNFTSSIKDLLIRQAESDPALKQVFEQITWRRVSASQGRSQLEGYITDEIIRRQTNFQSARRGLVSGEDFRTCLEIAKSYIGFPTPLDFADGKRRVMELVGEPMLNDALNSFEAVIIRSDIPSVRELARSRANEAHILWWQPVLIAYCVQSSDLSAISKPLAKTALALSYWEEAEGLVPSTVDFYQELRAVVLPDYTSKMEFLRDFFEPFFECGYDCVPRLELFSEDDFFDEVAGTLAFEWLTMDRWRMGPDVILSLLEAAMRSVDQTDIVELARRNVVDSVPIDFTEQGIWIGMLFGFDFERNREFFHAFKSNGFETLTGFRMAFSIIEEEIDLTVEQSYLIVSTFANDLRDPSTHFDDVVFDDEPVLAYEFIRDHVAEIALCSDPYATALLESFVNEKFGHSDLQEDVKGLLVQNRNLIAERAMEEVTLEKTRKILLSGRPSNAAELQAIVMDELHCAQRLVKFDSVNRYQFFWECKQPKLENDCRDAVVTILEPRLAKYGIRVSTETRMPGDTRSDILLSIGEVNVSIEVKCQWHEHLWTGASGQLKDYASDYRADGYGIYLVVFFGAVSLRSRQMKKSPTGKMAGTREELMNLLNDECRASVSSKISFFIWDVSLPREDRGSRNLGVNTAV